MSKTLVATARNLRLNIHEDGKLEPVIEAVLVTAETKWETTPNGEPFPDAEIITVRFDCLPEGARKLAKDLTAWADEIEADLERVTNPVSE